MDLEAVLFIRARGEWMLWLAVAGQAVVIESTSCRFCCADVFAAVAGSKKVASIRFGEALAQFPNSVTTTVATAHIVLANAGGSK